MKHLRWVSVICGSVATLLWATGPLQAADSIGDGVDGAPLRYHIRADGTIRDDNTLLIWEKKDEGTGIHSVRRGFTWSVNGIDPDGSAFTVFLYDLNNKCEKDETTVCTQNADCNKAGGGQCGYAGHRDWRMPNIKELQSIVDYSQLDPALALSFPGSRHVGILNFYWSSTTFAADSTYVWSIDFGGGDVNPSSKTDGQIVRAVRGP